MVSVQIQSNPSKQFLTIQRDNDPKHTTNEPQAKKIVLSVNSTEDAFYSLKTKLKAEIPTNKKQLKMVAVKAWQGREETAFSKVHVF